MAGLVILFSDSIYCVRLQACVHSAGEDLLVELQKVTTLCFVCLFVQAFTIMDQNRDGVIDKNDLRDTYAALGKQLFTDTQTNKQTNKQALNYSFQHDSKSLYT